MTPEGREKIKEVVRWLLDIVELPETLSEFMDATEARKEGDKYIVYLEGSKTGTFPTSGSTEYEAKENAWTWFSSLINECKNI